MPASWQGLAQGGVNGLQGVGDWGLQRFGVQAPTCGLACRRGAHALLTSAASPPLAPHPPPPLPAPLPRPPAQSAHDHRVRALPGRLPHGLPEASAEAGPRGARPCVPLPAWPCCRCAPLPGCQGPASLAANCPAAQLGGWLTPHLTGSNMVHKQATRANAASAPVAPAQGVWVCPSCARGEPQNNRPLRTAYEKVGLC